MSSSVEKTTTPAPSDSRCCCGVRAVLTPWNAVRDYSHEKRPLEGGTLRTSGSTSSSAHEWTGVEESQRLDHISGLVFEGSIAATAGAAVIAFSLEPGRGQWLAFIVTGLCGLPGLAVGWLLLWNPLRHVELATQRTAISRKRRAVYLSLIALLAAVPLLGILAAGALLFPNELSGVLVYANIIGLVVPALVLYFIYQHHFHF